MRSGCATPRGSPATCARTSCTWPSTPSSRRAASTPEEVRAAIEDCLNAVGSVGAAASWLLSDHDVSRPASRYGAGPVGHGPGAGDGAGAARAARRGLPLQRRRAGAARRRPARRGAPRRRVAPRRGQPRRLPRAAAVGGRPVRRTGSPPASPGCRSPTTTPRSAPPSSSRTPAPRSRCTGARWSCAVHTRASRRPRRPAPRWSGSAPRPAAWRSGGRARRWCARSTPHRQPVPLPPGDPLLVSGPLDDGMLPPDTAVWLA